MAFDDVMGTGMTRPPIPPPDMPTLSAIPRGGSTEEGGLVGAKGGALPDMFRKISELLNNIAAAAPGQSERIDEIETRLRDVMIAIANGGSADKASTIPPEGGGSTMMGGSTR
jgi:hypothetical protein